MNKLLTKNTTIKSIVENYLKLENMSIYKFSKESKLCIKTIKKILENTSRKFNKNTLEKLHILKRLNSEDKKFIQSLLNEKKEKKVKIKKTKNYEKLLDKMENLVEENEILKEKVKMYGIRNKEEDYFTKRKIGAFDNDLQSNSLLITKIWDFNENILKEWADVKLLLDINSIEKTKRMKKGLKSIADEFRRIANYLENVYFDSSEIEESEIINIEDKE